MAAKPDRRWYELRDTDIPKDLSHIRILAVPYDTWTNLGWGMVEKVRAHAFDRSIREAKRGIPLLLFHDGGSYPIGVSESWTLDDPKGLIGQWRIDTGDERAREAARKARDGYLTGASIGFQALRTAKVWNDEDGWDDSISRDSAKVQIELQEGRLVELSLTPTPAYVDAQVQDVRSLLDIPVPNRDSLHPVRMSPDTQLAIRDFRAFAERVTR